MSSLQQQPISDSPGFPSDDESIVAEALARADASIAFERAELLQRLAVALTAAVTPADVGRAILDVALEAAQAKAGGVLRLKNRELHVVSYVGMDTGTLPFPVSIDLASGTGEAAREGHPVYIASLEDWRARYPRFVDTFQREGLRASAVLPLISGSEVIGLLGFNFDTPREFSPDERVFLETMAAYAAQSLQRALLFESEHEARSVAERSARRAERLRSLTAALAEQLAPEDVARAVVTHARGALNASGGILLLKQEDDRMLRIVAASGYEDSVVVAWDSFPISTDVPIADCVRRGETIVVNSIEERSARYPALARVPWKGRSISVPLHARGAVIGALGLTFETPDVADELDIEVLTGVAIQSSIALERGRLFDAERRARAEAERANRVKMDFLAAMSHELRTPLNAIDGHAELLELGIHGPINQAQRDAIGRIRRSETHLLGLINDVLNFAKLDAGSVTYDIRTLRLHEVVREVQELLAPSIAARGLVLDDSGCADEVHALGDGDKIRQILMNLLSNAIKYTHTGGRIEIRCSHSSEGARRIAGVTVRDTGVGIGQDKREAIFEPFVQVGRSLSAPDQGTGLGLAISRGLARGMGGDLTVRSEPEVGSEFTLTLPSA